MLAGFKTLDNKMVKMQTTVDHVSSLVSAEMAKSNNIAVLAEKLTAAQGTTSTAVAELVAAREAATAAASTAPASTRSEKEIADEQHAQDRNKAKAIKVRSAFSPFPFSFCAPDVPRRNLVFFSNGDTLLTFDCGCFSLGLPAMRSCDCNCCCA